METGHFLKMLNDASLASPGFLMWKVLGCIICKNPLWVLSCKVNPLRCQTITDLATGLLYVRIQFWFAARWSLLKGILIRDVPVEHNPQYVHIVIALYYPKKTSKLTYLRLQPLTQSPKWPHSGTNQSCRGLRWAANSRTSLRIRRWPARWVHSRRRGDSWRRSCFVTTGDVSDCWYHTCRLVWHWKLLFRHLNQELRFIRSYDC